MARDPVGTLEMLVSLGFQRVLTSGCDTSALEGLPVIKRLIDQVCLKRGVCTCVTCANKGTHCLSPYVRRLKGESLSCQVSLSISFILDEFDFGCFIVIINLSGGGITERNLQRILEGSGAEEFHCSARSSKDSAMKYRSDKNKT